MQNSLNGRWNLCYDCLRRLFPGSLLRILLASSLHVSDPPTRLFSRINLAMTPQKQPAYGSRGCQSCNRPAWCSLVWSMDGLVGGTRLIVGKIASDPAKIDGSCGQ